MRRFGPSGDLGVENLVAVVVALREVCGVSLKVQAAPLPRRRGRVLEGGS